jgi:hypothetical protein
MSNPPETVSFVRWVRQTLAPAAHLPWRAVPGSAGVSQADEPRNIIGKNWDLKNLK